MKNFIMILMAGFFILIMIQYSQSTIASTDIGVNLTGTAYDTTYNNSTGNVRATMNFMALFPWLVAIAGFIAAAFMLMPSRQSKGL